MTIGDRIGCVLASIDRFNAAEAAYREVNANPSSTTREMAMALGTMQKVLQEFAWQLRNVEKIFQNFGIGEDSE